MTKFLKNADVTGYISQTSVTSSLLKTDADGKLVAAVAGTDYNAPNVTAVAGTLIREIRNTTGATLAKGTVVYISGATGNKATVSKAIATGDSTSAQTFGLCQTDIANNSNGYVVCVGDITGLDTSAFTEGVQLYLSSTTAGTYTSTKQLAPAHLVYIGVVTRSHPTQGQIEVKIQNGYELDEIHDVSISSLANNHTLVWESATSLWKNKTIAAALGYTPADDSAVVKLTGNQTVAGVKTFTSALLANNPSEGATGEGLIAGQSFKIDATGTGQRAIMYVVSRTLSNTYGSGLIAQYANFDGDKAFGFNLNTAGGFELYVKNTTFNKALAIANTMAATFGSSVTATSFIKSGGTSAQFLKADGSVDSTSYMPSITFVSPLVIASGGEVSIGQAGASANGYLSSTDWNTFNNKLSASTAASTYLPLTGGTLTGDLTLSGTNPRLYFTDTDNNPDYFISNTDGTFTVYDVTNSVGRFKIYTTGNAEISNNLNVLGSITGNIITSTSAGSTQLFLKSTGGGANRDWQWQTNEGVAGDISLMQSTTAGGSTYATKFNLSPTGAATFSSIITASTSIKSYGTDSDVQVGAAGTGGSFGFLKWDSAGSYMYLGHSYNSTFNKNLVVNSSGNVLIGTVTDNSNKLRVNGSGYFDGALYAGAVTAYGGNAGGGNINLYYKTTWAGNQYPTIYGGSTEEYFMMHAPHIPYLQNGVNSYSGTTKGAIIRYAGQAAATSYWDVGIASAVGSDFYSISRNGGGAFFALNATGNATFSGTISIPSLTSSGIQYSTFNTSTGRGNLTFASTKTILGNYHIQNGSGPSNNNGYQAAITFQGDITTEAQAGIYVLNNNSYGTAMGFATTNNYAIGPQIFMTASNTGVVDFPRANPTVSGNGVLHLGNYSSYALPLTGGSLSGALTTASPLTIQATNPYIQWKDASAVRLGYIQHATNLVMAADSGNIVLNTTSGSFTLTSGGAAQLNGYLRTAGATSNTISWAGGASSADFGNVLGQGTSTRSTFFRGASSVSAWWGGTDGLGNIIPFAAIDATSGEFTFWRNSGGVGGGSWTKIMTMNDTGLTINSGGIVNAGILQMSTSGTSYISMGRFPNSLTNAGEAWLGRAADRSTGTMTVQLGVNNSQFFEIVDYAWTTVTLRVGMSDFAYKGNAVLHAGNYSSYAVPLSGGTMSGTLTLKSISGTDQMVENTYGAYLHLGGWGVGRTDSTAVLVNTAYRADTADAISGIGIGSLVRKDTTGQYLKPFYEYSNYIGTDAPSTLTSQMGGGGFRVDFQNPGPTSSWSHTFTWSGYNRYSMCQIGTNYNTTDAKLYYRQTNNHDDAWAGWKEFVFNSGTWSINVTGSAGTATSASKIETGNNQWTWSNGAHTVTNPNSITLWDQYASNGGSGSPESYGTILDIYGRSGHEHDQLMFGASGNILHRSCFYGTDSWGGWRTMIDSSNIGSQSVSYASTAGSADVIDGWQFRNTGSNSGTNADSIESNGISYVNGAISLLSQTDGALYSQSYNSNWQHQIYGDYRTGRIVVRGKNSGSWGAWRTVWDSSSLDAPNKAGTSYYQVQTWLQIAGSTGLYAPSSGAGTHWSPGIGGSYGSWRVEGYKGGYFGIELANNLGTVVGMIDTGGNGGNWDPTYGWHHYFYQGCLGLGGSGTASGYKAYTNGNHYVNGFLYATSYLQASGAIYASGDITAYYSDGRLKENVQVIESALDKLSKIGGYSYTANDLALELKAATDKKVKLGVIAQEVKDIFPEVIEQAPFDRDPLTGESVSGDNYMTVKYERFVPVLIQGIKEQQVQIESQKSEISELKELVKQLLAK